MIDMAPNYNYLDVSPMIGAGGGSSNSSAGAAMNNNNGSENTSRTVQRDNAVVYADPGFLIVDDDENYSTEDTGVSFNANVRRNNDGALLLDSESDGGGGGWDETAMTNENSNNYMLSSTSATIATTKTVKTTVPTRNRIGGTRSSSTTARSSSPRRIRFASAKGLSRISLARNNNSSKQINIGTNSSSNSRGGVPTSSYAVMESHEDDLGGNQSSSAKAAIKVQKSARRTVKSRLVNIMKPNNSASSSDAKEIAAYEFQDLNRNNNNNDEYDDDDDYNSNDDEIDDVCKHEDANNSNHDNDLPWTGEDDGDILPMSDHEYDVDYYLNNDESDNDSISHNNAIIDNYEIENSLAVFNDDNENNWYLCSAKRI